MNIGIIGHEAAKFTHETEIHAKGSIRGCIIRSKIPVVVVSGHCHLGGIDVWAEECADEMNIGFETPWVSTMIFPPKKLQWEGGYKQRNIQIAENSDKIYVIVVRELPPNYKGMRFKGCYHCDKRRKMDKIKGIQHLAHGFIDEHIKSGACWTAWYAIEKLGKEAEWIVI